MKISEIKELIAIFSDSEITEMKLELENMKLHLSKLRAQSQQMFEPVIEKPSSATAAVDQETEPETVWEQPTGCGRYWHQWSASFTVLRPRTAILC